VLWISVDDDLDAVQRSIEKRRITGLHIAEGRGIAGAVPKLYRIPGSYFTYLIGRDGTIAAKDVHLEALAEAVASATRAPASP
jgi:hypothetical protein